MASSEHLLSFRPEITEECGVFGEFTPGIDSAPSTYQGINLLQHRGQEAAGIGSYEGPRLSERRGLGLIPAVFPNGLADMHDLPGDVSVGHTRYGTSHVDGQNHVQPVIGDGSVILAHNGNLPDTQTLAEFMDTKGISNPGHNDSYLMQEAVSYYVKQGAPLAEALEKALPLFTGAFSVVLADRKGHSLVGARDPWGMRPLSFGQNERGISFASETRALGKYEKPKEVKPGEILIFNGHELTSVQYAEATPSFDIFEILYLMRPDSVIFGQKVEDIRRNLGRKLAEEMQNEPSIKLDLIVGTPDTAIPAAQGLAEGLHVPIGMGLVKRPRANRTFITSDFTQRARMVEDKLDAIPSIVRGKDVGLADDTVVRGTTTRVTVNKLIRAGAKSVHLFIPSAPIQYPDFYGVNTPNQDELIANRFKTPEELAAYLGADSIHYLSKEKMVEATGVPEGYLSLSAFTGNYPIPLRGRRDEVRRVEPLRPHSRSFSISRF